MHTIAINTDTVADKKSFRDTIATGFQERVSDKKNWSEETMEASRQRILQY